jgi:hypothetical protein
LARRIAGRSASTTKFLANYIKTFCAIAAVVNPAPSLSWKLQECRAKSYSP